MIQGSPPCPEDLSTLFTFCQYFGCRVGPICSLCSPRAMMFSFHASCCRLLKGSYKIVWGALGLCLTSAQGTVPLKHYFELLPPLSLPVTDTLSSGPQSTAPFEAPGLLSPEHRAEGRQFLVEGALLAHSGLVSNLRSLPRKPYTNLFFDFGVFGEGLKRVFFPGFLDGGCYRD